jgi:hypothetical protein
MTHPHQTADEKAMAAHVAMTKAQATHRPEPPKTVLVPDAAPAPVANVVADTHKLPMHEEVVVHEPVANAVVHPHESPVAVEHHIPEVEQAVEPKRGPGRPKTKG